MANFSKKERAVALSATVLALAILCLSGCRSDTPTGGTTADKKVTPAAETSAEKSDAPPQAPAPGWKSTPLPPGVYRNRLVSKAKTLHLKISDADLRTIAGKGKSPSTTLMAKKAYQSGNYLLAAEYLKPEGNTVMEEGLRLLRAQSYFECGRYQDAAQDFKLLETSNRYKNDARWNYLLCQMGLGKFDEVKALVAQLAAETAFPYYKQVVEIKSEFNI